MPQLINMSVTVNRAGIRRETLDGREHFVVSSYTLPADVVMNGIAYPGHEIDKHYAKLEGTFAPLGHPQANGKHVSARTAPAINTNYVGAWNRNVKKVGKRIHLEKWVDLEVANRTADGRRLVERLEAMEKGEETEPVHTSVALFIETVAANSQDQKEFPGAKHVASIVDMDHDAILLDEAGAATPAQGVGMMVNADMAVAASMIEPETPPTKSFREMENDLREAAQAKLGNNGEIYVWVEDFSDDHAVITYGGKTEEFSYSTENGKIILSDTGAAVERKQSWISKMVANAKSFLQQQAASPATTKEGDMPMTAEERAALAKETAEALAVTINADISKALTPINDAIKALQDGQTAITQNLTANSRAAEAQMRAEVAAKYGDVVANGANGEALAELHKTLGKSPTLAGNTGDTSADVHKDDAKFIPA